MTPESQGARPVKATLEWSPNEDRTKLQDLETEINQADYIVIGTGGVGGKIGGRRQGESVVESGPAIEGMLRGLEAKGKKGTPVTIVVDEEVATLYDQSLYESKFWSGISFRVVPSGQDSIVETRTLAASARFNHVVVFDFNANNNSPQPSIDINHPQTNKTLTTVDGLFRTSVHTYSLNGQERRYADFVESLLHLPQNSLPGNEIQPTILLSANERASYPQLLQRLGLDPNATRILCGFQSNASGKCYEKWGEVIGMITTQRPNDKFEFFIAAGPDDGHQPGGFQKANLQSTFGAFTGTNNNARVIVGEVTLRELALLASADAAKQHSVSPVVTLSNDSLVSHISGASGSETVTPYLPGEFWPMRVWASTRNNHGITIPPNKLSTYGLQFVDLQRAFNPLGERKAINAIPTTELANEALKYLP